MPEPTVNAIASTMKVFLFTDLIDSTGWKNLLGDRDYARQVLAPHDRIARELIASCPGASLNNDMGDGFLATFPAPGEAVVFALNFHAALARELWGEAVRASGRVPATRIGIHLGQLVELEQPGNPKLSGQAVDLAARVMSLGLAGYTLLTRHAFDSARQFVRTNPVDEATPLAFVAHGQFRFKGNDDDPLEVFGVAAEGSPTLTPPPDSEKAKRVKVDEADDTGSWRPAVGLEIPRREGWILEKSIGEGGFGEVWLAKQKRTKEQRVFKFCFDADRLRSFKRELTLFRLLKSEFGDRKDFVRLYDVQVEKPPYLLESEFVPEGNLAEWAAKKGFAQWPKEDRLRFVAEVARTVADAHSLGIIHKDLKPSNILVQTENGIPKPIVADFGIGVLTDKDQLANRNITFTGGTHTILANDSSRTGTRLYSPPEAQLNKPATTGFDVYALGVFTYQMLVGDFEQPLAIGWEERISTGDRDEEALLREDLRTATLGDPSKRLPTAAALAKNIETLPARLEARKLGRQAAEQARRMKFLKRALGVAAAFALIVSVMAAFAWDQRGKAIANENKAKDETQKKQAALKDLDEKVATLSIATQFAADAAFAENRVSRAKALLREVPLQFRGFEWYHRMNHFIGGYMTLFGHTGGIQGVAFSPDSRLIISGSDDNTVKVWATESGAERAVLSGHTRGVKSVAFSPDGRRIVTGSADYTVKVWDMESGAERGTFKGHTSEVYSVAFSPDGRRIVTGSDDKTLKVWDAELGTELATYKGHSNGVKSVAFSPDGRWIISGSWDGTVKVWDAESGTERATLKGHRNGVRSVAFSPDGRRIVSDSDDKTVKIWDAESGVERATLRGHSDIVLSVAFSPDGRQIVSGSLDKTVKVWDSVSGAEQASLKGHTSGVHSVKFTSDGRRIGSGSHDNTVKVWDISLGAERVTLKGHAATVNSVAFSPDGRRIISGSEDKTAKIRDAESGAEYVTLNGHTNTVNCVAFSPSGRLIVTGSEDHSLKVWDAELGTERATLKGHTNGVACVAFSPDGQRLLSGSYDKTVKVWDTESGTELATILGHTAAVSSVAFSPDGRRIASGSYEGIVKVWNAASSTPLSTLLVGSIKTVNTVTFSPDGRRIITDREQWTEKRWDSRSGKDRATLFGATRSVYSVAFSPDGKRIVSGCGEFLKVWDADTGAELATLNGHRELVHSAAFSPDNRRIISGSSDHTVKVWDAESGAECATFKGHTNEVRSVAFSRDGRRIASASADKTVKVWDAQSVPELVTLKGHSSITTGVAFNPEHKQKASGVWESHVKVWEVESGQQTNESSDRTMPKLENRKHPTEKWWLHIEEDQVVVFDLTASQEALDLRRGKAMFRSIEANEEYAKSTDRYAKAFWKGQFALNLPNEEKHWKEFRQHCTDEPTWRLMVHNCDLVLQKGPNGRATQERDWALAQLSKVTKK